MTIIDFPTRSALRRRGSAAHPTASAPRLRSVPAGAPPTGAWLDAYEQLAACCAEVVARRSRDPELVELQGWIRTRLSVLDALKEGFGAVPPGAS